VLLESTQERNERPADSAQGPFKSGDSAASIACGKPGSQVGHHRSADRGSQDDGKLTRFGGGAIVAELADSRQSNGTNERDHTQHYRIHFEANWGKMVFNR
jgi:hypothetical protein